MPDMGCRAIGWMFLHMRLEFLLATAEDFDTVGRFL
jgi:hypothetical protein